LRKWKDAATLLFSLLLVITAVEQKNANIAQTRAWLAPRGLDPPDNIVKGIDGYTVITFRMENVGKDPARRVNEYLQVRALRREDFNNNNALDGFVRNALSGNRCEEMSTDEKGRTIFAGAKPGRQLEFQKGDIEKINNPNRPYYALVAGCLVYSTLGKTHFTKLCIILAQNQQNKEWESVYCPVRNDAD
jgi:hypothetical protein